MNIESILTYGKVAESEFEDIFLFEDYKIILYKENVADYDPLLSMDLQGDPLHVNLMQSGDPIEKNIKAKEFVLSLNSITDMQWLFLGNQFNLSIKIEVYKDTNLMYVGYFIPDTYNEPYTVVPYPTTISFADGLTFLRDIDFKDSQNRRLTGRYSMIKILAFCLSKLGNNLGIMDAVNIINSDYDSEDEGFLEHHTLNLEAFRDMNCYDVIEDILKSCNSKIEQTYDETLGSYWKVTRIKQYYQHRGRYYNRSGDFQQIYTVGGYVETTGAKHDNATRCVWQDSQQQIDFTRAWKQVNIYQDYGKKRSILPSYRFEDDDFIGDVPRNWSGKGISKATIGDQTFLKFDEKFGDVEQFLRTQIIDEYHANGFDSYNINLKCLVGSMTPVNNLRRVISGTSGTGRRVVLRQYQATLVSTEGSGRFLKCDQWGLKELIEDLGYSLEGAGSLEQTALLVFDSNKAGLHPGYYYRMTDAYQSEEGDVYFKLYDTLSEDLLVNISSYYYGEEFNFLIAPAYLKIESQHRYGGVSLNNFGNYYIGNLRLEIPVSAFDEKELFDLKFNTELCPFSGDITFRIDKPKPRTTIDGISGSFYIKEVLVQLTSAIEGRERVRNISDKYKNNGEEINIKFAEIRTNYPQRRVVLVQVPAGGTLDFTFYKGEAIPYTLTLDRTEPISLAEAVDRFAFAFNKKIPFGGLRIVNIDNPDLDASYFEIYDALGDNVEEFITNGTEGASASQRTYNFNNVYDLNQKILYYNSMLYKDEIVKTHNVISKDNSVEANKLLSDIQTDFFFSLYQRPRQILSGLLQSNIDLQDRHVYDQYNKCYHEITAYNYSIKNRLYDLTMQQVYVLPEADPLDRSYSFAYSTAYGSFERFYNIRFRCKNASDEWIGFIAVDLTRDGVTRTSGSGNDGRVDFSNVKEGTYTYRIYGRSDAYQEKTGTIVVNSNEKFVFVLDAIDPAEPDKYTVTFRCEDEAGNELDYFNVEMDGETKNSLSSKTITFEDVYADTYVIKITKSGYQDYEFTLTINSDKTVTRTLTAEAVEEKWGTLYLTLNENSQCNFIIRDPETLNELGRIEFIREEKNIGETLSIIRNAYTPISTLVWGETRTKTNNSAEIDFYADTDYARFFEHDVVGTASAYFILNENWTPNE